MGLLSLLVPALLACVRQDEGKVPAPPPDAKWKADFALSIVEKDGKWVFHIDGVTNFPPEVKLRARIYALETFTDFKEGEREDDEPLVWEDEAGQPSFHLFHAEGGGQFHEDVYKFVRRPYSIRYRAKIHYNPKDQTDAVTLKLGDEEFFRKADLRFGTDAAYAAELRERVKEVADDLVAVEKLYGEVVEAYPKFKKAYDAEAWNRWKTPWLEQLEPIEKRNEHRYSLWAVWMERQAKMRVGGMCELLMRRIINAAEIYFAGEPKADARVQELFVGFHQYFEEAIEVIGVNAPLDARTVGPLVAAYDKGFGPLRVWINAPRGDGADLIRAARRECLGSLLTLAPLLQNRKRGYLYVNEISVRFTGLLELLDAKPSPEVLKKGLDEHDAALAEFKKFAGIK
jgi:hypothetical protein